MTRTEDEKIDARLNRQAKALHAFIAALMDSPMETADHPLPDIELSPREIKALLLLGDKEEMIMTDLATALSAPLSTVTRIIDRLERKQMVERFRSEEDRRIVTVKESEKGKMLREHFRHSQLDIAARMLQPLSNGEREILIELLEKLTTARSSK
ncbi:MAG: MarR family transcriptional regulator [Nitrospira sp.]|nr:MarR family transcriptional regulator [Nitrospira sp.]